MHSKDLLTPSQLLALKFFSACASLLYTSKLLMNSLPCFKDLLAIVTEKRVKNLNMTVLHCVFKSDLG